MMGPDEMVNDDSKIEDDDEWRMMMNGDDDDGPMEWAIPQDSMGRLIFRNLFPLTTIKRSHSHDSHPPPPSPSVCMRDVYCAYDMYDVL